MGCSASKGSAAAAAAEATFNPAAAEATRAAVADEAARVLVLPEEERAKVGKKYRDPEELFLALEAPDDDLKMLVMDCLLEVPIDNLQAQEVSNIVSIVADCDNLTVGRTEEILSHAFAIMMKLATDDGEDEIELLQKRVTPFW